jgi:acyl-CoA thioester hydrolase
MTEPKEPKPITYEATLDVRFGDLDAYGHVNSKNYLDFIISSRWIFLERVQGISAQNLIDRGLGFFLTKSEMSYKRPIHGSCQIYCSSYVTGIEGAKIFVAFSIQSLDRKTLHSNGTIEFTTIDLKLNKPRKFPEEDRKLFFL